MATAMEIIMAIILFVSSFIGAGIKRYYRKKSEQLPTGKSPVDSKAQRIITLTSNVIFGMIYVFLAPFFLIFNVYHLLLDWASLSFLIESTTLLVILQGVGISLYVIGYTIYCVGRLAIREWFSELWSPAKLSEGFISTGIYSRMRHPLYAGGIIFSVGLIIAFQTWFALAIYMPALVLMINAAFKEEQWLLERFGDAYKQYMQRTWRFFPKFI